MLCWTSLSLQELIAKSSRLAQECSLLLAEEDAYWILSARPAFFWSAQHFMFSTREAGVLALTENWQDTSLVIACAESFGVEVAQGAKNVAIDLCPGVAKELRFVVMCNQVFPT